MVSRTRLRAALAFVFSLTSVTQGQATAPATAPTAALPPAQAAATMKLPPGFRATLFAGEPDVVQPIAFAFDDRGRVWVAESMSYPNWQPEDTKPQDRHDRIVILEDADGDGRFDKRTVFADHLMNLSGIELGFGGVFLCSTPNLLFIPDADGDDKPDSPATVLLNGFSYDVHHNVFNGMTWGPDGWLWGMHGILGTSKVGPADMAASDPKRVAINCGVWRMHPLTHAFEVVASGTTNPWGLDFDDYGEAFITNCVIAHVFHVIPGAHYQRMYGEDLTPHTYGLMSTCADHLHWGGGLWTESRGNQPKHSAAGGGHAHVGAMVYLGENWPAEYRNTLFTCNLHGLRVNNDTLEQKASGYVAHHGKDFLFMADPFFRGLALKYGPDGGVYMSDWSDTGECHDYDEIHRESGRIYKITYGDVKHEKVDVAKLNDDELVRLQSSRNEWLVRHARRVLQERAAGSRLADAGHTRGSLRQMLAAAKDAPSRLRAFWALHAAGGVNEAEIAELLGNADAYVRAWAVRLAADDRTASPALLDRFAKLAASDPSPVVRVYLASTLQRIPGEQRWPIVDALAAHEEDANDPNIPLMIWYGIEPLVPGDPARATKLVETARIPLLRQHIARRLTEIP
jgi:putative membrane-bound dehydrogenase-like protein